MNDDAVRHGQRLVLVVGYHDGRDAEAPLQRPQFDLHALPQRLVERAKRLVEQQKRRFDDQGAGQPDALLLAPDSCAGMRSPYSGSCTSCNAPATRSAAAARLMPRVSSPNAMFSATVHVREQRVILEQHADIAAMHWNPRDRPFVEKDLAGARLGQPAIMRKGRRLAAA